MRWVLTKEVLVLKGVKSTPSWERIRLTLVGFMKLSELPEPFRLPSALVIGRIRLIVKVLKNQHLLVIHFTK